MARRGDSIRKRKDGRWEGRYIAFYTEAGKAKYKSVYGHSYSEAKSKLMRALGASEPSKSEVTFQTIAEQWLEQKKSELKPSTFDKYSVIVSKHLRPAFGYLPIFCIDTDVVESFIQQKCSDLSIGTIKTIVCVIKSILGYAQDKKMISHSIGRIRGLKSHEKKCDTLSSNERETLGKCLLLEPDIVKIGIYLCLYTGLRIGELCALRWADIDLNIGVIKVRHTVQRIKSRDCSSKQKTEIIISSPKTYSSMRDIPISSELGCLLESYRKSDDVFLLSERKDRPMEPRCLQYRFKKILKEANLDDINFHALRHSFASECIAVGFDVKSLSEILGHNSVEITLNRYVHSSDERKRTQMSLLFSNNGQMNRVAQ